MSHHDTDIHHTSLEERQREEHYSEESLRSLDPPHPPENPDPTSVVEETMDPSNYHDDTETTFLEDDDGGDDGGKVTAAKTGLSAEAGEEKGEAEQGCDEAKESSRQETEEASIIPESPPKGANVDLNGRTHGKEESVKPTGGEGRITEENGTDHPGTESKVAAGQSSEPGTTSEEKTMAGDDPSEAHETRKPDTPSQEKEKAEGENDSKHGSIGEHVEKGENAIQEEGGKAEEGDEKGSREKRKKKSKRKQQTRDGAVSENGSTVEAESNFFSAKTDENADHDKHGTEICPASAGKRCGEPRPSKQDTVKDEQRHSGRKLENASRSLAANRLSGKLRSSEKENIPQHRLSHHSLQDRTAIPDHPKNKRPEERNEELGEMRSRRADERSVQSRGRMAKRKDLEAKEMADGDDDEEEEEEDEEDVFEEKRNSSERGLRRQSDRAGSLPGVLQKRAKRQVETNQYRCGRYTKLWNALKTWKPLRDVVVSSDLDRYQRDDLDTVYGVLEFLANLGIMVADGVLGKSAVDWMDAAVAKVITPPLRAVNSFMESIMYERLISKVSEFLRQSYIGSSIMAVSSSTAGAAGKTVDAMNKAYVVLGLREGRTPRTRRRCREKRYLGKLLVRACCFPLWAFFYVWATLLTLLNSTLVYFRDKALSNLRRNRWERALMHALHATGRGRGQHPRSHSGKRGEHSGEWSSSRRGTKEARLREEECARKRRERDEENLELDHTDGRPKRRHEGVVEDRRDERRKPQAHPGAGSPKRKQRPGRPRHCYYTLDDVQPSAVRSPLAERGIHLTHSRSPAAKEQQSSRVEYSLEAEIREADKPAENQPRKERRDSNRNTNSSYRILKQGFSVASVSGVDQQMTSTPYNWNGCTDHEQRSEYFDTKERRPSNGLDLSHDLTISVTDDVREVKAVKIKEFSFLETHIQDGEGGEDEKENRDFLKTEGRKGKGKGTDQSKVSFSGKILYSPRPAGKKTRGGRTRTESGEWDVVDHDALANRKITPVKRRLSGTKPPTSPGPFRLLLPPYTPPTVGFKDLSVGNQFLCLLRKIPYLTDVVRDPRDPPALTYVLDVPTLITSEKTRKLLDLAPTRRTGRDLKRKLSATFTDGDYDSADDPDYEPDDLDTTDPLEYSEDDAAGVSENEVDVIQRDVIRMVEAEVHQHSEKDEVKPRSSDSDKENKVSNQVYTHGSEEDDEEEEDEEDDEEEDVLDFEVSTDEEGSTESNQEDSKDLEEASDEDIVTNDAISNDAQQPMMKNGDSIHDNPHDDQNQSHHGEKDGDDEGDEGHHHHIPCSERKIEITDMAHSNGDSCLTVG